MRRTAIAAAALLGASLLQPAACFGIFSPEEVTLVRDASAQLGARYRASGQCAVARLCTPVTATNSGASIATVRVEVGLSSEFGTDAEN